MRRAMRLEVAQKKRGEMCRAFELRIEKRIYAAAPTLSSKARA
jgi:hypothetical protein